MSIKFVSMTWKEKSVESCSSLPKAQELAKKTKKDEKYEILPNYKTRGWTVKIYQLQVTERNLACPK